MALRVVDSQAERNLGEILVGLDFVLGSTFVQLAIDRRSSRGAQQDWEESGIVAVLFAGEARSIVVVGFAGKETGIAVGIVVAAGSFSDRSKVLDSVLRFRRGNGVDSAS